MAVTRVAVDLALTIFRDQKTPLTERRRQMRDLVAAAHFDFAEMARSALGTHWRGLAEDKRKQFVASFTAFVEYDFLNKIEGGFRYSLTPLARSGGRTQQALQRASERFQPDRNG